MNINHQKIKQFWISKINEIMSRPDMTKTRKVGNFALGDEADWKDKLDNKKTWQEINDYVLSIATKVYKVNQSIISPFKVPYNNISDLVKYYEYGKEYDQVLGENTSDFEKKVGGLQAELDNYKNKWDGHSCGSCSHTDYDTIKRERDEAKVKINNLTQEKNNLQTERDHYKAQLEGKTDFDKIKRDITKQIITDSGLDLEENSGLEQVITRIKELIKEGGNGERERERERESDFRFKARKRTIANSDNWKEQSYCWFTKTPRGNYERN